MLTYRISITQEILDEAEHLRNLPKVEDRPLRSLSCPVALGLAEATHRKWTVGYGVATLLDENGEATSFHTFLPDAAKCLIKDADSGRSPSPTVFNLRMALP